MWVHIVCWRDQTCFFFVVGVRLYGDWFGRTKGLPVVCVYSVVAGVVAYAYNLNICARWKNTDQLLDTSGPFSAGIPTLSCFRINFPDNILFYLFHIMFITWCALCVCVLYCVQELNNMHSYNVHKSFRTCIYIIFYILYINIIVEYISIGFIG